MASPGTRAHLGPFTRVRLDSREPWFVLGETPALPCEILELVGAAGWGVFLADYKPMGDSYLQVELR